MRMRWHSEKNLFTLVCFEQVLPLIEPIFSTVAAIFLLLHFAISSYFRREGKIEVHPEFAGVVRAICFTEWFWDGMPKNCQAYIKSLMQKKKNSNMNLIFSYKYV